MRDQERQPAAYALGGGRPLGTTGVRDALIRGSALTLLITALGLGAACDPAFVPPDHCGDGVVDPWEGCDDGALDGDDGCSATCTVEAGWACSGTPSLCVPRADCGNRTVDPGEGCDDGNATADDGCSPACQVEPGWRCIGEPSVCTPQQEGWLDPAWTRRKPLVIDHTAVAEDLSGFPVLVLLADDPDLASQARTDGADLVFTAEDGVTPLAHELQRFRDATGELIAWVRVTDLPAATDTTLYLYYGNPDATDGQDPDRLWAGYEAVLHLQEQAGGLDDEYRDSSGQGHHGTGGGVAGAGAPFRTPNRATGLFGEAQDFDDANAADLIRLRPLADDGFGALTVQAWVRPSDAEIDRLVCKAWGTAPDEAVWVLGKQQANVGRVRTGTDLADLAGGTDFVFGTWTHVALTWTAGTPGTVRVYRDGVLDLEGTVDGASLYVPTPDVEPTLGNVPDGSRGFRGLMQEVRLASGARTAGWLLTEVRNQSSPETFVTPGPEETAP